LQLTATGHRRRTLLLLTLPEHPQTQLMGQQLFKRQSSLGGMPGARKAAIRLVGRRPMQQPHGVCQRRHLEFLEHPWRQQFLQAAVPELRQRLLGQVAPAQLMHPLGGRIDRRQRLLDLRGRVVPHPLDLGMDDLEAARPAAHLAETPQRRTAGHVGLLRIAEMKKPQRDRPRAVGQLNQQ
jgi:hypothetical protein